MNQAAKHFQLAEETTWSEICKEIEHKIIQWRKQ